MSGRDSMGRKWWSVDESTADMALRFASVCVCSYLKRREWREKRREEKTESELVER